VSDYDDWIEDCSETVNRGSQSPKPNKYRAQKTIIDGHTFPSTKEAMDYAVAKRRQEEGEISGLTIHPVWECAVNGKLICKYEADLAYWEKCHGDLWCLVVQDSKGMKTPVYNLKKKLMLACHGIDIREV
jgi:hypothetical protein